MVNYLKEKYMKDLDIFEKKILEVENNNIEYLKGKHLKDCISYFQFYGVPKSSGITFTIGFATGSLTTKIEDEIRFAISNKIQSMR